MKPNNFVALLVVAILLAIGVALAVINKRSENDVPKPASQTSTSVNPAINLIEKDASYS